MRYHLKVLGGRELRATIFLAALIGSICSATPARADALPPHAQVGVVGPVDAAVFRRSVAARYHVEFRKVVATDIDRDGDLDVVATTENDFTVWVNDGLGHLRADPPSKSPVVEGEAPPTSWHGGEQRHDETIQDDVPSVPVPDPYAHAPPIHVTGSGRIPRSAPTIGSRFPPSSSRAPPA